MFGCKRSSNGKSWGRCNKVSGNYEKSLIECIEQSTKNNWQIVQDVAWKDYMLVPKYNMAGYSVMMKEIVDQIVIITLSYNITSRSWWNGWSNGCRYSQIFR